MENTAVQKAVLSPRYLTTIYRYLMAMTPGEVKKIVETDPQRKERFISHVKYLMDYHPEIRERIEFNNQYTTLRCLVPFDEFVKSLRHDP